MSHIASNFSRSLHGEFATAHQLLSVVRKLFLISQAKRSCGEALVCMLMQSGNFVKCGVNILPLVVSYFTASNK